MSGFKEISPEMISGSVIERIGRQWMLLAAEKGGRVNMMTASWGGLGVLWNKPVSFTFIRPERYTFEFANASDTASMTFLGEEFRPKLNFCGTKSGRDFDKVKECGFTVSHCGETPYFDEAGLVLICKKLYVQQLKPSSFVDASIDSAHYSKDGYHHMFVGEIVKVLEKQ